MRVRRYRDGSGRDEAHALEKGTFEIHVNHEGVNVGIGRTSVFIFCFHIFQGSMASEPKL